MFFAHRLAPCTFCSVICSQCWRRVCIRSRALSPAGNLSKVPHGSLAIFTQVLRTFKGTPIGLLFCLFSTRVDFDCPFLTCVFLCCFVTDVLLILVGVLANIGPTCPQSLGSQNAFRIRKSFLTCIIC